jgi:hypothetical protein
MLDAGTTTALGLLVGKSGIGAPIGAPGMGLRVIAKLAAAGQ